MSLSGDMMKEKPKKPFVPPAMQDTVRQEIIAELREGPCSARDLSAVVRIPERDVAGHLEHIRKTIAASGMHLVIMPAECKKCGFVFSKRDKLTRPGKCPLCKGESIMEPTFMIESRDETQ
jgi:predicted Zn-ribbon and HTH transcriptional regulator